MQGKCLTLELHPLHLLYFETRPHYVTQVGLERVVLLPTL